MKQVKAVMSDLRARPYEARWQFFDALRNSIFVDEARMGDDLAPIRLTVNCLDFFFDVLCFWLRDGALYEPSPALGVLLEQSDLSMTLPMSALRPPVPAMCIMPPPEQRWHCGGAISVQILDSAASGLPGPDEELLFTAYFAARDGGVTHEHMSVGYGRDDVSLNACMEQSLQMRRHLDRWASAEASAGLDEQYAKWRSIFEYLAKVLLYLKHDGATVRQHRPYSCAPRVFPSLGKRKRELRLAQIEQLYDRYIVGPESLPEALTEQARGTAPGSRESATHWRRGHFRSQPYGPQASLRKVIFQPPILVRADKLADATPHKR